MKKKTILSASFLLLISASSFGQAIKDQEKQKVIDSNPTKYLKQGGILPDQKNRTGQTSQVVGLDFIIHNSEDVNEGEVKNLKYQSLDELNKYQNQTSSEYQILKENWVKANQLEYNRKNPAVVPSTKLSTDERLKKYNK